MTVRMGFEAGVPLNHQHMDALSGLLQSHSVIPILLSSSERNLRVYNACFTGPNTAVHANIFHSNNPRNIRISYKIVTVFQH
jgi:hypothetical protein